MSRYIDADKFISYIDCGHLRNPAELCFSEIDVVNMINKQATADVKDKSRFVELPCKVGDMVLVDWDTWRGNDFSVLAVKHINHKSFIVAEVVSIVITKKQKLLKLKAISESGKRQCNRYPVSSIGVTVFFTEAEAE